MDAVHKEKKERANGHGFYDFNHFLGNFWQSMRIIEVVMSKNQMPREAEKHESRQIKNADAHFNNG